MPVDPNLNSANPTGAEPAQDPNLAPSQPATQAPQTPTTDVDPIAQVLSEYNIDTSQFDSPKDAIGELINIAGEYNQNRAYIDYGRQAAGNWDKFQEFLTQQGAQQPAQQPPQEPVEDSWKWSPPEFNREDLYEYCDVTQSGRFVPKRPEYSQYANQANQYLDWKRQAEERIIHNFPDAVRSQVEGLVPDLLPKMEESISSLVEKQVKALVEAREQQAQADQALQEIQDDLFVKGQDGQFMRSPSNPNEFVMTDKGKAFNEFYTDLVARGMTHQDALQVAVKQHRVNAMFSAPATPPVTPQEQANEQRQTFLDEATAGIMPGMNRDGTYPQNASEPPQSPNRIPTARDVAEETIREMEGGQ